ncbi:hypothetical protein HELRODRAFT_183147 [Helobdella robusta]|uniref:Endonuclease/exonuclease/phosphatase domain-containing protein n=1 Tax=Helobdella robusta TaxID=6412 RepID=T1FJ75_HELRO|nr:hypothetical protein HELRODRAFT_183147 [Helobdella robusta]ESO11453.1 hypothetical protein HELRODRAFT_183147 [Helobdella robusta]
MSKLLLPRRGRGRSAKHDGLRSAWLPKKVCIYRLGRRPVNKVRAAALGTRGCSVKYATESQKDRLKMGLTVGVWNVRSLWQTGAYALMKKELERFRYDVVGLCEVRWTEGGEMEGGKILWSGTEREHVYGVGMVIGEKAKKALLEYNPVNERMMYARFKGYPRDIDVVVAYAPTMDHSDAEIEAFYDQLEQTMNVLPNKRKMLR